MIKILICNQHCLWGISDVDNLRLYLPYTGLHLYLEDHSLLGVFHIFKSANQLTGFPSLSKTLILNWFNHYNHYNRIQYLMLFFALAKKKKK